MRRYSLVGWLQNSQWSIRTKLMGGFLVIALFLALLTVLSVVVIRELGQKINQVANAQEEVRQSIQLVTAVTDLKTTLENARLAVNYVATGSPTGLGSPVSAEQSRNNIRSYQFYFVRARTVIEASRLKIAEYGRAFMSGSMAKNTSGQFFETIDVRVKNILEQLDAIINNTNNLQSDSFTNRWKALEPELNNSLTQIDAFRTNLEQLVIENQAASRKVVEDANNAKNLAQYFLAGAGLVAIIVALAFGLVLTLTVTRPVERFRRRLVRLAGGDLVTILEVGNRDQFGELAGTFNQSINRLGGVVEQVQSQALRVSSAAAQIAAASSHSAMISAEQAGAVAEATVTIEELSHTAIQIADAATLVANAAEQALSSASDGQSTVRESIVGINKLKNQVSNITDRILALSERSQRVGHIIDQVASIADQTHLLALNAAIESAAAGENGKRFAVVAASVKQLAERSRQATKDVQAVLSEIQAATNASVMATEQGLKEAERGVTLAHLTGDANENIIQMVERTVQLASAISLATQQQRSASEQVVASMRQLATVIQDGATSAKQSSSLATALDKIALELRRLASQFKVQAPDLTSGDGFSADGSPPEFEATGADQLPGTVPPNPNLRAEPAN